jgi:hypothetical protein
MSNELTVFDLDHTLVIPDLKKDKEHNFLTIDHCKPIHEMMNLFYKKDNKIILTNRHPCLQETIQNLFKCPVICRNYCLEQHEMDKVNISFQNLKRFLAQMVEWKIQVLNDLSTQYESVIFYDDHARDFSTSKLNPNISVHLPLNIQSTQLSNFLK